jgi:hypothetical protein
MRNLIIFAVMLSGALAADALTAAPSSISSKATILDWLAK